MTLQARLVLLVAMSACVADPFAVRGVRATMDGAGLDTVWLGAPGEAVPGVNLRFTDGGGKPLAGASVEWKSVGRNAQVVAPAVTTNKTGEARAGWVLGTDASEEQQLNVTVFFPGHESQIVIRARAVPHIVSQLRVELDTAALRLGDTLQVGVEAIDPYGNPFPAPDVTLSLTDSAVASVAGSGVVGGPRRGRTIVRVAHHGVVTYFPLRVMQHVAAIVPAADTMRFSSLGAELPVAYVVRDDRDRLVADTTATLSIADTAVAQVSGSRVRSVGPGATALQLTIGSTAVTVNVGVEQRIASLMMLRDTVHFDALLDTTTLHPIALDSLNAPIRHPALVYDVSDGRVATVAAGGTLTAVAPGAASVTVRDPATGISATAPVVVRQRIATIEFPQAIQFSALGDTLPLDTPVRVHQGSGINGAPPASPVILGATALDRLGSIIVGAVLDYAVSDSTVVALEPDAQLRSVSSGQALVIARDPESGITGQGVIVVDQVATTVTVTVAFGNSIVALPVGTTLPLTCRAFDRNGFPVLRDPTLVRSVNGTVAGTGCADARVQHSGYDTLFFALGAAQASVPVTVSTGDSVGVVAAAQPLTTVERQRFVGEDLAHPSILALRPLVAEILAAYGNPTTNLGRARALRDWLARTAIHPHPPLHPDASTSNLGVLPPGKTWADVNALIYAPSKDSLLNANNAYWWSVGYDGYAMLDRLLGTLDPTTGLRADDGMMLHVGGARYQIRDVQSYRYPICTFQAIMLNALWAAAGLHGMLISTIDHDPATVFIPELGRWVYEDPTFNEEYLLDGTGDPLSPVDLLTLSSAGEASRLQATKLLGPSFDREVYIPVETYRGGQPEGTVVMGSQLNSRVVGVGGWPTRLVQIDVPRLAQESPFNNPLNYVRVTAADAFPSLGVVVEEVRVEDSVYVTRLSSTLPNHQRFERRMNGGSWESVAAVDVLPVGECRVEYRSVDAVGSYSASTLLNVWVPRADGFVESGLPGSVRTQAQYSISMPGG